ncbi:MAG: DUF4870 domain-containing protein [Nanoarchaeota archaeon]
MAKTTKVAKITKGEKEENNDKIWAFLGILLTIVGFVLVLLLKKESRYAMYYAKQGLVLFIAGVITSVASAVLNFVPFLGKLVSALLWLFVVILWIMGLVYSLSGAEKKVPLIGEFAEKIKI